MTEPNMYGTTALASDISNTDACQRMLMSRVVCSNMRLDLWRSNRHDML